ncbi:MAG TPA: glucose-6-phosphate isomerase [Spirochaetia bacterium]|nr:glucose-6-phosphate isomerase [Spirochaetales bacterium]HRS64996.1 glucose-6-phosphate isomerase [Spirochaetia bacterium]HOT59648.1 glucose-6-phosphate isomerase [Spirochaetales bacterium]HPD79665.1 glucose-6-phosphate isomerase [Spirochaetales bacterium]HQK34383.1 glucose-6-phosphate isomerase [Spirochaetales bacterium]
MQWKGIHESHEWQNLIQKKPDAAIKNLSPNRIQTRIIDAGGGLSYSYAAMDADDETIAILQKIADELQLIEQYKTLLSGAVMNIGEKRMVLHHAVRGTVIDPVIVNGKNYTEFYAKEVKRFCTFAENIRNGTIRGSTGAIFTDVVQIGIGGSDLGPRALYLALENWARTRGTLKLNAHFISNVDPDDAVQVLENINPETTLFILVSKSGTTQETLANEFLVKKYIGTTIDPAKHFVAVTSETSPLAHNTEYLESFYIDDYIGGRYSGTSAVGGVILTISLGPDMFKELLIGANEADKMALNTDITKNAALMDALLGVYERSVLNRPVIAVLPYAQALSRFPAHLQQLDMESNGKSIDRNGRLVPIPTGPIVMGEPGTNGQHSFYQLLHQGTTIVPIEFIGFSENQCSFDPEFEGSTARKKLNANLVAQIAAFAQGSHAEDPNKNFPGMRPSSLIFGKTLSPKALGALLAHFENKIMFQGFAWNLNSFDQEGVQLGKVLTKEVLNPKGISNPVLAAYAKLLGL